MLNFSTNHQVSLGAKDGVSWWSMTTTTSATAITAMMAK